MFCIKYITSFGKYHVCIPPKTKIDRSVIFILNTSPIIEVHSQ